MVLGHTDYGESDRIIQLICPDLGRVAALARRVRSPKNKRFRGALELGSRVDVELQRGRGELWHIKSADLVHGRPHLRAHLESIALAAYLCEWVRELGRSEQPEPQLFGLLDVALLVLDACTEPPKTAFRLGFEAKALTFAGLTPALTHCATCAKPASDEMLWSPASGGVVHPVCDRRGVTVEGGWALGVEGLRRAPLAELVDTEAPLGGNPWLLSDLFLWQQNRPLRSRSLLISLEPG